MALMNCNVALSDFVGEVSYCLGQEKDTPTQRAALIFAVI